MSRIKRPLPDKVLVSSAALAQIINALNGPGYMVLELTVTRSLCGLGAENPIDVIERELVAYHNGEVTNDCPYAIDADFENCIMRNHVRVPPLENGR